MSHTYSEFLPSYSVGVDCYKAIPEIVKPYGKKAVAVGGKTAMEKSKKALLEGIKGSDIEIIDFVWYGGDSSYENVEKIKDNPSVQKADMVFGIGGGRAVDTAKTMCRQRQLSRLRLTLLSRRDLFQILPSTKTIRIPRRIITTIHRSHIVFITVHHSFRNVNGSICTAKLFHSVCCVC